MSLSVEANVFSVGMSREQLDVGRKRDIWTSIAAPVPDKCCKIGRLGTISQWV